MGAGHASTSIGYAVGLKEAMRKGIGEDGKVAAVIGDGALTGGVAYEAMHAAGGLQTPVVIVLNDNGMSISPNVGALSRYFNRVRLNPRLYHAREGVEDRLTRLPLGLGKRIERLGPEIKSAIKAYWAPGLFFEELDLAYMGVIDGHDVHALRAALSEAFEAERPGGRPHPHGQGQGLCSRRRGRPRGNGAAGTRPSPTRSSTASRPRSRSRSRSRTRPRRSRRSDWRSRPRPSAPPQYTQVFAEAMVAEARRDRRVIGITAAMAGGTGLQKLADRDPRPVLRRRHRRAKRRARSPPVWRFRGQSRSARSTRPSCSAPMTRSSMTSACRSSTSPSRLTAPGSLATTDPTHHGAFDISYLRPVPNIIVMAPRDEAMLVHMLRTALTHRGPAALRYPRGAAAGVELPKEPKALPIGSGELLASGERVALLGYGYGVAVALEAGLILAEHDLRPTIADARFAKPLDGELCSSGWRSITTCL